MPVLTTEALALAVSPGQPGYSGCFICGDRSHQFRDCPRRSAKGSSKGTGKVHFGDTSEVFMVTAEDPTTSTSSTAFKASSSTTSVVPELPTQVLDQAMFTATSSTAFRASSSTTPVVPCRDSNRIRSRIHVTAHLSLRSLMFKKSMTVTHLSRSRTL